MSGVIQRLDPRGFGFIFGDDGVHYFFHAKKHFLAAGVVFEKLVVGQRVQFTPAKHPFRGPRAVSVLPVPAEAAA